MYLLAIEKRKNTERRNGEEIVPIILRIDVDNPYGWFSFHKKVLNYFSLNFKRLPIRHNFLGYLDQAKYLFKVLEKAQIPATWFFRVQTKPSREFQQKLIKAKHEIAYHAERTSSLRDFQTDLQILSKNLPTPILGFSKHGSGKIKLSKYHTVEYNLDFLIKLGQDVGFKYFSGNDEIPTAQPIQKDKFLVFPGAFWLDEYYRDISKYNMNWLIKNALKGKTFVVLTHPHKWAFSNKERDDFQTLMESINDFQTFSSMIS